MATFSSTQGPEDVCLPCQQGNLFLCEMPQELQDKLQLRGFVNDKDTPILPVGEVHTLTNSPEESINKVELMVDGKKRTLIKDLAEFGELDNSENLRVFIGANESKPENPEPIEHRNRTEYAMQNTGEKGIGVFGFEIADLAGLGIGVTKVADMSPEQKITIGKELGTIFGIKWADINKAYGSVPSGIVQEIVNLLPEFLDSTSATAAAAASASNGRAMGSIMKIAVFETLVISQSVTVKIMEGKIVIFFKSHIRYAKYVSLALFPVTGVASIDTRIQASGASQLKSAAGGVFKGTGGVFLLIGAGLNIAEYLSKAEAEQFLSDLFLDLAVMVAIAIVSAISAVALAIFAFGAAAVATAGFFITVMIAGTAFFIGWLLNRKWAGVEGVGGIDGPVKAAVRKFIALSNQFFIDNWHGAIQGVADEIYQHSNHNLPSGDLQLLDLFLRGTGGRGVALAPFSR